jgi:DNA-binding GntR family transcriptional regulator
MTDDVASRNKGIPKWLRIMNELIHDIETHRLAPGDKLPTEEELMDRFKVSRTPVQKARAMLVSRGLIEMKHPKGAFVVKREPVGEVLLRRDDRSIKVRMPTPAEIAALGLLEAGEPVAEIVRANADREVHSGLSNSFAVDPDE